MLNYIATDPGVQGVLIVTIGVLLLSLLLTSWSRKRAKDENRFKNDEHRRYVSNLPTRNTD